MICGGHFENMQIRSLRRHFQLANIVLFFIQHTKLPLNMMSNHFPHEMHVLVSFSGFLPDYWTFRQELLEYYHIEWTFAVNENLNFILVKKTLIGKEYFSD